MSRLEFLKVSKANAERLLAMSDAELGEIVCNGVTVELFKSRLHQNIDEIEDELIDHLAIQFRNGKPVLTHIEV